MKIGTVELIITSLAFLGAIMIHIIISIIGRRTERKIKGFGLLVYGIPLCFLVASVFTPPDLYTFIYIALPLCIFYSMSVSLFILFIWLIKRSKAK